LNNHFAATASNHSPHERLEIICKKEKIIIIISKSDLLICKLPTLITITTAIYVTPEIIQNRLEFCDPPRDAQGSVTMDTSPW